jgi:GWxTD domain-containing protein
MYLCTVIDSQHLETGTAHHKKKVKRMSVKKLSFYLLVAIIIVSCRSSDKLTNIDFAHLYSPEINLLYPDYQLLHTSLEFSRIIVKINSTQLKYKLDETDEYFIAEFNIHIKLLENFENKRAAGKTEVFFTDTLASDEPYDVIRELNITSEPDINYWLYLEFSDNLSRNKHTHVIFLEKQKSYGSQFFSLANPHGEIIYSPFHIGSDGEYVISYFDALDFDLNIARYLPDSVFPSPPFSETTIGEWEPLLQLPDTTFTVNFVRGNAKLLMDQPGIYHIYSSDDPENGFLIQFNHANFPYITMADDMLLPLRYISSNAEFTQALGFGDAALALDRFWARVGGNPDRADELIRRYYHRADKANKFFTSGRAGWQTDRGMIFIVFGPPHQVHRNDLNEIWRYPQGVRSSAVQFYFRRQNNPFTPNHYILDRDPAYRSVWNIAVDNWRR